MGPTKAKVRKTKGEGATTPQVKRTKRAGSKGLAPGVTVQGQYQINGKEVPVTIQDDFPQKLDALVKAMTDLSR